MAVARCFSLFLVLALFGLLLSSVSSLDDATPAAAESSEEPPDIPSAPPPPVYKQPTVLLAVLVRNKQHTLPYFFRCLEELDYPKERIALWIRSDHNIDKSAEVVETWLAAHGNRYHSVDVQLTHSGGSGGQSDVIQGEEGVAHWPKARYSHVIHLREEALTFARRIWADYLWMLDCDVFITNPVTLTHLVSLRRTVVAPMLRSDGLYSNFWCGMTPELYYMRTDSYTPILNRKSKGCHRVPMVHSAVLLDLRAVESDGLTYSPDRLLGYAGPRDDIITFARSANMTGVNMYVCNEEIYGYIMVPLEKDDQLSYDLLQLRNLKLEILGNFIQRYI